ncbi:MAG: hypothetical protein HXK84_09215, partial [Lachnospiraceae bacterium]|nr:hypothetical protein [Lachnospiraceae bacterium]
GTHGGVRGRRLITASYSIGIAIRIVIPIDHLRFLFQADYFMIVYSSRTISGLVL